MDESAPPEGELGAELRALGENLKTTLNSAWESEERKKIQAEIEAGLADLSQLLKDTAEGFEANKVGQEIKTNVEDFRDRVERGEVGAQVRTDLMKVLQAINAELQKFQNQWTPSSESETTDEG